jgi:hypothetical protein
MLIPTFKKPMDVVESTTTGADTTSIPVDLTQTPVPTTTVLANPTDTVKIPEKPL